MGKTGKRFFKGCRSLPNQWKLKAGSIPFAPIGGKYVFSHYSGATGYELKMHNLSRLLELSKLVTDGLAIVLMNETAEDKLLFALLQDAYAQSRYSLDFDPEEQQVTLLFSKVAEFNRVGENIYRQYLAELGSA